MVKIAVLCALLSVLALTSADDEYDYDDDCYEPDDETTISSNYVATTMATSVNTVLSTALSTAAPVSTTGSCPILPSPTTIDTITALAVASTFTEIAEATTVIFAGTVVTPAPNPADLGLTITAFAATSTIFFGPTFTSVIFDVSPAETTVTVPRPSGFTPLKCQSVYAGPYDTTTLSFNSTLSTYTYTTVYSNSTTTDVIFPSSIPFPTVTGNQTATESLQPTTTITSTRADPTATVYAACLGTDNVTPDSPPSKYRYVGQAVAAPGVYSSVVPAIDQVDCCAQCHANDACTGSTFYTKPVLGETLDTYYVKTACQLFLKNDTTNSVCDGSFVGATMQFDYPQLINYISNGPCGQFDFLIDLPRLAAPYSN